MADNRDVSDLTRMTAQIVSSYVSNNDVSLDQLPGVIKAVGQEVAKVQRAEAEGVSVTDDRPKPPVKPHNSVRHDHLVCLECGKKLKMLKRHLRASHNLTPEQYRERWGLSPTTPMTAPKYQAQRSEIAKQIGLGKMSTTPRSEKKAA